MQWFTIYNIFVGTPDHDVQKRALELNSSGNKFYKQKNYTTAVDVFTKAIEMNPTATYYVNRSSANTKLNRFTFALDDATKAIEFDPTYSKGYSRRADAYKGLEQYLPAIEDYERAMNMEPNNTRLKKQIAKCRELLHQDGNFLLINIVVLRFN